MGSSLDIPQPLASGEEPEQPPADDIVFEAPGLIRIVWADPQYMPEHLAVWTLARFGPRADAAVEKLSARDPAPDRDELEQLVITRKTRVAMTEGAFVGGPFIVLLPVAFCAALLAQGQMVFELAAAAGDDPTDRIRAAELLVLLEVYSSIDEAEDALERMNTDPKSYKGKKLPRGSRWSVIVRMAYLLQVLRTGPERSRLRAAMNWAGLGVLFLVGLVLPLVWVPYMAYVTRRSSLLLGNKARRYYAASKERETGVVIRQRPLIRIGGAAALARTLLLVVVPIGAALIALLTGTSLTGGHLVTAVLVLLAVSLLATLCWLGYRWWRHHRRRHAVAQAA